MTRRIGILGGTFDPIHVGHLVAAVNARYALSLDSVLLVVANQPWQKLGARPLMPATDRLAVVAAAVEGVEGVEASAIEIDRGGLSYTIDTIEALLSEEPDLEIHLIVGADVVPKLSTWHRHVDLAELVQLVVVNRPGTRAIESGDGDLKGWRAICIEIPALEISSTDLRERAKNGRPLDYLIPSAAIRMIRERGLYATDEMQIQSAAEPKA